VSREKHEQRERADARPPKAAPFSTTENTKEHGRRAGGVFSVFFEFSVV
jgi:hypothetical protein